MKIKNRRKSKNVTFATSTPPESFTLTDIPSSSVKRLLDKRPMARQPGEDQMVGAINNPAFNHVRPLQKDEKRMGKLSSFKDTYPAQKLRKK